MFSVAFTIAFSFFGASASSSLSLSVSLSLEEDELSSSFLDALGASTIRS